jgi:hypothetical protein
MANLREQFAYTKLYFKMSINSTETFKMYEAAFGEQAMGKTNVFSGFHIQK